MVRGWFRRWNSRNRNTLNTNSEKYIVRFFTYDTLRIATNNFSDLLGHGGYASVFKGVLPEDGRTVAIKRLHKLDRDGFLEKIEFMSHLRHINIIQVIGCCVENDEQLIVYEYAQNGNISHHLHSPRRSALNWERRAAICIGTARGLLYLHEEINPRAIHRDIKPSNILLDANFVPKISDFDLVDLVHRSEKSSVREGRGASKERIGIGDPNTEDSLTHTTIKGTMGYLAPDYFISGQYTEKVDVYGFGLVILEIITGRKTVDLALEDTDDRMILNWVTRMKKDGKVLEMVDPVLIDFPKEDVERFINVALLCTQATSEQRPSMFEVIIMLHGRHKSNQEISEMAMRVVTETEKWSCGNRTHSPVSTYSLTNGTSRCTYDEAEFQEQGEMDETQSSSHKRKDVSESKCKWASKEAVEPVERRLAHSSTEEQSFTVTDVSMYFHKSIEKIMKAQVGTSGPSNRRGRATQTMVIKRYSKQVSMEAVYPPFLSGEYRPSRSVF